MKRRSGFTLVELLIVISLLAIILPLAGRMVYSLLRAQAISTENLSDEIALSRFAETFRKDVHLARRVESGEKPGPSGMQLVLDLDGRRSIRYSIEPGGAIVREATNGPVLERREQFRINRLETRFERDSNTREVAALHRPRTTAENRTGTPSRSPVAIRVAALIGRDLRFHATAVAKGTNPLPLNTGKPNSGTPASAKPAKGAP